MVEPVDHAGDSSIWYETVPDGAGPSTIAASAADLYEGHAMASPSRTYSGASADDRLGARRRKLLDAGFALLASEGARQVTIDGVCRAAGLNKRYFYESFADLGALVAAVVDEIAATLTGIGLGAARTAKEAGLATDVVARAAMTAVVTYLVSDPRRARLLFTEAADHPRAAAHRKAVIRQLSRELSAFGHEYHGATVSSPIADLGSALLVGGSIEILLGWLDRSIDVPLAQLIDDLAALWVVVGDGAVRLGRERGAAATMAKTAPKAARPAATRAPQRRARRGRDTV
jgi:AcrR family transcriptional regulator